MNTLNPNRHGVQWNLRQGFHGLIIGALLMAGADAFAAIIWRVEDGGNGHSYTLTSQRSGWLEVEAEAQSLGGHLVSINSAEEQQFIVERFLIPRPAFLANGRPNIFWIGLWDETPDGSYDGDFAWSDGSPITYTHWGPVESSNTNYDEEFAVINWDEEEAYYDPYEYGRWNDIDSVFVERSNTWNGAYGIVEFPAPPPTRTPTPTPSKGPVSNPARTNTPTLTPTPTMELCHDVSGDDQVDSLDLFLLLLDAQTNNLRCDFNGDEIVDATDIFMFMPCWMNNLPEN